MDFVGSRRKIELFRCFHIEMVTQLLLNRDYTRKRAFEALKNNYFRFSLNHYERNGYNSKRNKIFENGYFKQAVCGFVSPNFENNLKA